jgi:phage terminase large subunit-like protein
MGKDAQDVYVFRLSDGQSAIYNSKSRFRVCAAGRRFGKSHIAAVELGQAAMQTQTVLSNGSVKQLTAEHGVYYVAPTQDMGRRIMWPKLRALLGFEKNGGLIRNENVNDGWLELISGRRIYIKGADNPDSLRGIGLSFVVLDEFADMKANVWDEILSDALGDVEGRALFIGTPKGKNHFYRMFMGALMKPARDEQGNDVDWSDWEAFHFESTDNPFLTDNEKKRMLTGNRSMETIRQEVKASFISGGGKTLKPDWFKIVDDIPPLEEGQLFVTVDLAGFKKTDGGKKVLRTDETVIAEVLVYEDKWYILNIQHGHWDVRETALNIVLTLRKHYQCRLGIEAGALANAVGPYLEDYMRQFQRYVTVEPLKHGGARKQDRIAWALQGRAERDRIKLRRGSWNDYFIQQCADFPDQLAHDDALDAVAYVDQMCRSVYNDGSDQYDEWQPLDLEAGF